MTMIKGKIFIKGLIQIKSPLHIGCGSDQRSDMDILLGYDEKPFIPATSLIGVLRHTIKTGDPDAEKNFWGYAKDKEGCQSAIRCSDLICRANSRKVIRDGIQLDHKTGMVKYQGKYDYEILERGAVFELEMEFNYNDLDKPFVERMAATVYQLLQKGEIQVGGKTNNGMGKIGLVKEKAQIYRFDFSKKQDVFQWLTNQKNFSPANIVQRECLGKPFETVTNRFRIDVTLELKHSLIIRSYSSEQEMPDAVHMKSLDDWILTGSSLKGAIRARAERITKTLEKSEQKSEQFVNRLFGFVKKNRNGGDAAAKGKLRVREIVLPKYVSEMQNRIKIDRFTGGTIEGALFDTMPVFSKNGEKVENLIIEIVNCTSAEAGLLLLVLKDLWTGDLAIGGEKNIGRGTFKGTKAFIEWNDEKFILDDDIIKRPSNAKNALQQHVNAFLREIE